MSVVPEPRDTPAEQPAPEVYYDGACPLCTREIAFYQRLRGGGDIRWTDISKPDAAPLPDGLTRASALARFHVRASDGELLDGAAAFAHLWSALPRLRLLGRAAQFPPMLWALNRIYAIFLILRPLMQRWAARLG